MSWEGVEVAQYWENLKKASTTNWDDVEYFAYTACITKTSPIWCWADCDPDPAVVINLW